MRKFTIMAAIAAFGAGLAAADSKAQDSYVIGLTGDLSGPASGTYRPLAEGFRVYFDALNKSGGINGQQVRLMMRDSRSDPNQAVADLNFFDSQKTLAVAFVSPSGTLGAYAKQSAQLKMPTIYVNACYPPATPPKPAEEFFCPGVSVLTDSLTAVDIIEKLMGKEKIKLAFLTTDIPGARGAAEKLMKPAAEKKGIEVVDVAVMPVGTTDASAIARGFQEKGVNAVISYTISSHMLAGADALTKLKWKGKYLLTTGLPGTYTQMEQLKNENIYAFDHFSLFSDNKPVHKAMIDAAQKYNFDYPISDIRWGWRNAQVMAAALTRCGAKCDRTTLLGVMNNLIVDDKNLIDLNGGPVQFTPTNHTSPEKSYNVFHWSNKARKIVPALDWFIVKERDWN